MNIDFTGNYLIEHRAGSGFIIQGAWEPELAKVLRQNLLRINPKCKPKDERCRNYYLVPMR